jgi:outer membrane protein
MHTSTRHRILALCGTALALAFSATASATNFLQVYQQALLNDPAYLQAHAIYMAAREARPEAFAVLLPQLTASAGENWDHTSGVSYSLGNRSTGALYALSEPSTSNTTGQTWSLNLSENLFSWTDWMNFKAADRQVAQAQATYEAAQQGLILTTAQAYFGVLAAVDTLHAQQSSLKALTLALEQAREEFKVGLIPITDVEQARAARDASAAQVITDEQALSAAEDQLQVITGRLYTTLAEPGENLPLATPRPADQHAWVQTALQQNLTLIATRFAADAADYNVRAAYGSDIPTISVVASRSYSGNDVNQTVFGQVFRGLPNNSANRQIGIEFSLPLFSGGGDEARIHQAEYQSIAAQDAVEQASRSAVQQARDAYLGVISGIANVRALRQALASSRISYVATMAGYKVGTQTEVDVLNALSTLVAAQTNYASSRYNYIDSIVALQYAAGTLHPQEVATIDSWLTKTVRVAPGRITPSGMTPPPTPKNPPLPMNPPAPKKK